MQSASSSFNQKQKPNCVCKGEGTSTGVMQGNDIPVKVETHTLPLARCIRNHKLLGRCEHVTRPAPHNSHASPGRGRLGYLRCPSFLHHSCKKQERPCPCRRKGTGRRCPRHRPRCTRQTACAQAAPRRDQQTARAPVAQRHTIQNQARGDQLFTYPISINFGVWYSAIHAETARLMIGVMEQRRQRTQLDTHSAWRWLLTRQ